MDIWKWTREPACRERREEVEPLIDYRALKEPIEQRLEKRAYCL